MTDMLMPKPATGSAPKRVLAGVGLVVLAASAVFGANPYGVRDRLLGSVTPEARPPAASRLVDGPAATTPPGGAGEGATVLRSQPWWQKLTTLEGAGNMAAPPFAVDDGAIQWRVRWTCQTGRLVVQAPASPRPVVDAACPGSNTGYGTKTGPVSLDVRADGPWQLQVEQQIDLPLNEPPLPAMTAPGAAPLARGNFYRIDQNSNGQVTAYRLPDGSHALRLDEFYVTPNSDLEILLSPLAAPRTTDEIAKSRYARVARLDITTGSLNFTVPPGVDPAQYRSVVIWCERLYSAYAAASLTPP